MTKIFITIPWFVPAFRAGGPIQSVANLVKEFSEGVEYSIFCGDTDLNGAQLENIETNQWVPFNDHTKVWYATPERISDALVTLVEKQKPDILFIIGVFSWHFNIVPMMFCKGMKKIISTRGMLHPGALSQKRWKKKAYLKIFKLLEFHYKVQFHATDEEEKNYIKNYLGKPARIFIAGNFPNKIAPLPIPGKEPGKLKMISVAIISPMKNILEVLEALSIVKGEIDYNLYGPVKEEAYWDLCKEKIKSLPENITVTYHGEIKPERVKEVLQDSHVFILPSKSENFGHAIFEALSAGRPVITSSHTPWNSLQESNAGLNVMVCNAPSLSEAIDFFTSMDEEEMERWSRGAHDYSERAVDTMELRKEYRDMFF
ncbi:MAG: glycosyltransferase [Ginsengibacter sp.]